MATSIFMKVVRTAGGDVSSGRTVEIIPQANFYPNGALLLSESSSKPGLYYRDDVADGEYKLYIDSSMYEDHIWHGEDRLSTIADHFDADDSYKLKTTGIKDSAVTPLKMNNDIKQHFDAADSYKLKTTGLKNQTKTVNSVTDPTPDYIGQVGEDTNNNGYVAIALTGTMWKSVGRNVENWAAAIAELRMHNSSYSFGGFADTFTLAPATKAEGDAYKVTESGTVFGVNATKGQWIVNKSNSWVAEDVISDHPDVVLNNIHRNGDGSDHSDVVLNNTHRSSNGTDHSNVVSNTIQNEAAAIAELRLHNPSYSFCGFADTSTLAPATKAEGDAYKVTESGTVFDVNAIKGQWIVNESSSWVPEDINISYTQAEIDQKLEENLAITL